MGPAGAWGWAALALASLLGLGGVQVQAELPALPALLALGLAASVGLGLLRMGAQAHAGHPHRGTGRMGRTVLAWFFALCAVGCLSAGWATWRAERRLADALPPAWEGRVLTVEAEVDELPQAVLGWGEEWGWRLVLRATGPFDDPQGSATPPPVPGRLSVLWFPPRGDAASGVEPPTAPPKAGEHWRFALRLRRPHGLLNPGTPDTELWLLERNLRAQGQVVASERLAAAPVWSLAGARETVRERIAQAVPDARSRALLAGLVLGDQAALSSRDWAVLRDTGVVHLFSISGLHITVFAWLAAGLCRALWRRLPGACLRWPAPTVGRWAGLALATAYALFAGWGIPAQRTVALLAVMTVLRQSARDWPWLLSLCVCALPVAWADPWALVQPGFWLSFAAVAVLMHMGSGSESGSARGSMPSGRSTQDPEPGWAQRLLRRGLDGLRTQAVVSLGLAPVLLLFFGQLSLVGLLANLFAVPLVSSLLAPLSLLGALLPGVLSTQAWALSAWGLEHLWTALAALAGWPGAVWSRPLAPPLWQALGLIGGAMLLVRAPWRVRALGGLALTSLLAWTPARPPPGHFALTVLDVGQGSAVWVQTHAHDLLYDAGPRWGPAGAQDAGARVVLPFLRAQGVQRLDRLVLSHADADHSGGARSVLQGLPVGQVLAPAQSRPEGLHPPGAHLANCQAGQSWVWDGVRFAFLHPPVEAKAPSRADDNAQSCVLRVVAAGTAEGSAGEPAEGATALLPGDLPDRAEAALLAAGHNVQADLLVLGHHGSAGSSSAPWLQAVQPRWAVAQAGRLNRHGHPAPVVLDRLQTQGVAWTRSWSCGALRWDSTAAAAPACWRAQARRYWHGPWPAGAPTDSGNDPANPLQALGASRYADEALP